MAQWALRERPFAGGRVLEVGCGLGVAGIAAARSGASVLLTDYEEDALAFARWNGEQNGCATSTEYRLLDWRRPNEVGRFPWIIGADVVYERQNFLPLLETLGACIASGGEVVLSDPDRQTATPFLVLAEEWGWQSRSSEETVELRGKRIRVFIHRLVQKRGTGCRA